MAPMPFQQRHCIELKAINIMSINLKSYIHEKVLATHVLFHPLVDELRFSRSIGNVTVPVGTTSVIIRPHDSNHGNA